jgi:hypothetical protein
LLLKDLKSIPEYVHSIICIAVDHAEGEEFFRRDELNELRGKPPDKQTRERAARLVVDAWQIEDILGNMLIMDGDTFRRFKDEMKHRVENLLSAASAQEAGIEGERESPPEHPGPSNWHRAETGGEGTPETNPWHDEAERVRQNDDQSVRSEAHQLQLVEIPNFEPPQTRTEPDTLDDLLGWCQSVTDELTALGQFDGPDPFQVLRSDYQDKADRLVKKVQLEKRKRLLWTALQRIAVKFGVFEVIGQTGDREELPTKLARLVAWCKKQKTPEGPIQIMVQSPQQGEQRSSQAHATAPVPTGAQSGDEVASITAALNLLDKYPALSNAQLANELGCTEELLSGNAKFRYLAQMLRYEKALTSDQGVAIIAIGNRQYGTGSLAPVTVTENEDNVLQVFLEQSSVDERTLIDRSGVSHAPKVLTRLRQKYDKRFAPAIRMPGRKHAGGYRVNIKPL